MDASSENFHCNNSNNNFLLLASLILRKDKNPKLVFKVDMDGNHKYFV